FLLKYLIRFANDAYTAQRNGTAAPPIGRGVGLALGVALLQATASVAMGQFTYRGVVTGGGARAALVAGIFKKSLRISAPARAGGRPPAELLLEEKAEAKRVKKGGKKKDNGIPAEGWTNGHVTNLMSTDSYRVDAAASWFHMAWTAPIMILLTLVILLINISYSP